MPASSGKKMAWCSHCGKNCDTSYDYPTNNASCVDCGKILYEGTYSQPGGTHVTSKFVRIEGSCFKSHRRTLCEGNVSTNELIYADRISHATRKYKGREMIWCPHCVRKVGAAHDDTTGSVLCVDCGKILCEDIHAKKTTFRETTGGQIPVNETEDLDEEHYGETDDDEWKSYDNKQESCSYSYDYDYDGGDENDDY